MKRAMRRRKTWQRQAAAITAAMMAMSVGGIAYAMPQGEVIRSGKGEITRQDKDMTVNQDSKRLAIDWSGFDIANDERVTFRQPDKDSVALNRVVGDAASVIDGTLSGNGHVYVINPNGVLFGKNASVDVGSLVASTARISDSDMTNFANADGITMAIPEDSSAKVINAGTIRAEGGLVVLHAAEVENSGTITNPEGTTALAAARNLSLSADTAGKINFTVDGALAKAKALNSGALKADGGYLVMTARSAGDVMSTVVNNTGTMEAKTLRQNEKGEILLDGGDNGIVELNGTLDASGMEAGQSAGSIKAIGAETHVEDGATLHAIGAVDGGLIETSGDYLEIGDNVDIDAAGKTGKAGEWLLDPLEVVISNSQPSGSSAVTNGNTDGSYNSSNDASGTASRNKTTWVNSNTVNRLLNKGTAVSVQATDANKVASITLDSAINKTSGADTSLTLEAQRNVTVNAGITSTSGALDVNLHSDTDGDGLGAVLINANIATNGGTFTSGSGTTIKSGSVGTYFGNQGKMGDRHVTTNGGAINLYGDVAIGLNGGTLTLDTRKDDGSASGGKGTVTVTGTIDSGNSYKRVASGLEGWTDFVKSYYDDVIRKDKSSSYRYTKTTTTTTYTVKDGRSMQKSSRWWWDRRYIIGEDGTLVEVGQGEYGYLMSDFDIHTTRTTKVLSYDELNASQKSDLSSHLAAQSITWDGAKAMAQGATNGTNNTGDTYLATITTALENSLASPPEEYQLIVGGQGSGDATRLNPHPADPSHPDGYYWVTGPEGMANNGKGTKFAYNDGSAVDNYYVKWNYSYSQDTKKKEKEPNNSGPIVSIGFGTESKWDDVLETAGTIRGFVQEKNLEHSGLVINAGDSKVDIAGNIGNSVALKNVEINAGDVAIGSGEHYTGIVHSDEGVSITGKDVTVGDRITADTKGVDIQATGDIDVDGITAHENINLTTTGESSAIVLNHTHNDGALITKSTDNDAVIIDARGTDGSFKNLTTAEKAITTGEGGNWKVYSYSPDADTFGTNLYSGTNAQWGATSDTYLATNDENKYIFQVQPTVYVTANDMTKVYGEELTNDAVTTTAEATFTGQDNKEHNVNEYTNAFNEGKVADYYNGSGTFTSAGWAKTATRTGGDKAPASEPENNAIYNIKATSDSYNLTDLGKTSGYADATTKDGGTVEVLRRQINVNGSGSQTYGNATINDWKLTAALTGTQEGATGEALANNDKLDESTDTLSIKSGSSYAEHQVGRTTADANPNPYEDAVNMENVGFENGAGVNYEIVKAQGDLKVNKANLTITTNGFEKVYGDVEGVQNALKNAVTVTGLTNGDNNGESMITVDGTSEALIDVDGEIRTNNVKDGGYDIDAVLATDLQNTIHTNYNVTPGTGKAVLTKKGITLITDDIKTTYGDGNTIRDKVNNDLLHLEGLVSWDKESDVFAEITPGVSVDTTNKSQSPYKIVDGKPATDEKGNLYTNDVRDDKGYSITTHYHNVANNYNVTSTEGHVKVTKAKLQVKVGDVSTTYGTAFDTSKYTYSYADGIVNGDTAESLNTSLSNKLGLLPGQYVNTAARDGEDGVWTADAGDEYTISLKSTKGRNFFDYYLKNYDTEVLAGKATVEKANLVVNVGNAETVYGTKFDEKKYSYDYSTEAGETLVNGDTKRSLATELGKIKYYNEAALDGTDDKWTAAVGDTYKLMFTNGTKATFNALNNYNVSFVDGKAKVTPASLTIQIDDASTVYGTKFDEKKYGYS
ncbi:filamentous hemagglutinin N-terminal domain-containing protein, partial [Mitsuokella multacida]|uniref:two-partner secretion domain-containing protein n=1 Tax=Mitsuokella multacida TaxID=52226 RepID=UPI003CFF021A